MSILVSMRFLQIIPFAIDTLASSLYDPRFIDVSLDLTGKAFVQVSVAGATFPIPISLSGKTILPEITSGPVSLSFRPSGLEVFHPSPEFSPSSHQLGIGPGSSLLEQFGSIGFIRDVFSKRLVVHMSIEELASRCSSPPSTVPLFTDSTDFFSMARLFVGDQLVAVGQVGFDELSSIIRLGGFEANWIGKQILSLGGEVTSLPNVFSNCGPEKFDQLPMVTLAMDSFGESVDSVSFNFLPREYLEIDERSRYCRIISGDKTRVNPFRITGINFMVTESSLTFCNSI
jgi:hypothetical protein